MEGEKGMEVRYYICKHCGNIVEKVKDKGVPVICCGEPMQELKAGVTDAAVEKHVPVYTIEAFEFWKASNNNFSKRYRVVHTRSDLSVRRPCIAVLHPASIEVSPVCLESKKKDP